MKTLLITLLSILIVISCTPYRYLSKHHNEICSKCIDEYTSSIDTTGKTLIKIDTVYVDVSENLYDTVKIYLRCDSLGNVILVTTKKLTESQKIISKYLLNNNVLTVVNERLNDSIMVLNKTIISLKNSVQTIEKPAEIIYKVPVWVYICSGFLLLFLIILLVLVFKK